MLWPTPITSLDKPMDIASQMMPPPPLLPISMRRPSLQMIVPEIAPEELKKEIPDTPEVPQTFATIADLTSTQSPSMDTLRRFVSDKSNVPLPSLSVENFLSNLEGVNNYTTKEQLKAQLIPEVPQLLDRSVGKTVFEEPSTNMLTSVQSNISNLTSSVMINTNPSLVFTSSVSNPPTTSNNQENLSIIGNSTLVSETSATTPLQVHTLDLQHSSLISQEQKARLDALVSSALVGPTSATERLDAFVNSAADSHISPGSSPTLLSPVATMSSETPHISPIQTITVSNPSIEMMHHQDTSPLTQILQETPIPSQPSSQVLAESSLCSLLSSTPSISNIVSIEHLTPQPINLTQSGLSIGNSTEYEKTKFAAQKMTTDMDSTQNIEIKDANQFLLPLPPSNTNIESKETSQFLIPLTTSTQESVIVAALQKQEVFDMKTVVTPPVQPQAKKCEEGMPLPQELTNMSEHDLLSYINPSYFDKGKYNALCC